LSLFIEVKLIETVNHQKHILLGHRLRDCLEHVHLLLSEV